MMEAIAALTVAALAWALAPAWVGILDPYQFVTSDDITFVGAASAASTSSALPTGVAVGDLAIVFAVSVAGAVSIPSGWDGWTGSIAGGPTAHGWKLLTSTDVSNNTTGTWTNASQVVVVAYRNAMFNSGNEWAGAASGSASIPALSHGTWIVGFEWISGGNIKGATVTGLTNRSSGFTQTAAYLGDCIGAFAAAGTGSGLWRANSIAISSHSAGDAPITGGHLFEDDDYWYCAFNDAGTPTVTVVSPCVADILIIGGGGGGGTAAGGGGGAGGVLLVTGETMSSSGTCTVGGGGAGGAAGGTNNGTTGTASSYGSNTADGGGYGGGAGNTGANGGSGGGGGGRPAIAGGTATGNGAGNAGGASYTPNTAGSGRGGGGGGATAAGTNGDSVPVGGNGTSAYGRWLYRFLDGEYVGGGGGGAARSTPGGNGGGGGLGGGGRGGNQTNNAGVNGTNTLGAGGGGASWNGTAGAQPAGGNGGRGAVTFRVAK